MTIEYSKPRMEATIENWPSGRQTVTAHFYVETAKRGQRGCRQTDYYKGGAKPKTLTYARAVRIVDGSDGKIYFAELDHFSENISIMRGTMDFQQEYIASDDPRHAELRSWLQVAL
jgi:hypothetical protein